MFNLMFNLINVLILDVLMYFMYMFVRICIFCPKRFSLAEIYIRACF